MSVVFVLWVSCQNLSTALTKPYAHSILFCISFECDGIIIDYEGALLTI